MKKISLLILPLLIFCSTAKSQQAEFVPPKDIPRNIIIIMANGMGINQVTAAALKKGSMPAFAQLPVTGFAQAWSANDAMPTDSSTATAIATSRGQVNTDKTKSKTLFDWAKEKKMLTALISTGTVTGPTARCFALAKPDNKDDETLALDYLNANVNILIGGGSRYFDKRYDGRNLFKEMTANGYTVENNMRSVGTPMGLKTISIVAKNDLYRASERKGYLSKATLNVSRSLTNGDGYLLVVDDTKIKEADTLNNIDLLTEEILDLDKLTEELNAQGGNSTLILVIGGYEVGGLGIKSGTLTKKKEPDVTWVGKTATATLAPVYATGPGSAEFAGNYSLADVYTKLEGMMIRRR
jgi:alkaline phosphatase